MTYKIGDIILQRRCRDICQNCDKFRTDNCTSSRPKFQGLFDSACSDFISRFDRNLIKQELTLRAMKRGYRF